MVWCVHGGMWHSGGYACVGQAGRWARRWWWQGSVAAAGEVVVQYGVCAQTVQVVSAAKQQRCSALQPQRQQAANARSAHNKKSANRVLPASCSERKCVLSACPRVGSSVVRAQVVCMVCTMSSGACGCAHASCYMRCTGEGVAPRVAAREPETFN